MVFTLRQLQEKAIEQSMPLFMVFIDFTKAFDTVNRDCLWALLKRYGCPDGISSIITQLHTGMRAQVSSAESLSSQFTVNQDVKQGRVLAPSLFSLYLAAIMELCSNDGGVCITTRSDGRLFNIRRLKASTKTRTVCAKELLYADDSAFIAHIETDLQAMLTDFNAAASSLGLTINVRKTEVMIQRAPDTRVPDPCILLNNEPLKVVQHFT